MKTTRTRIGAALAIVAALTAPAHALDFNTVIVSGRPDGDSLGPQLADPTIDFGNSQSTFWSVNAGGQVVVLQALETSVPVSTRNTLYRWTDGTKELLARNGSQLPGMPEGVIVATVNSSPSIADDGAVLFGASFVNGSGGVHSGNDTAYILAPADGPAAPLAREGNSVPGIPGAAFGQTGGTPNNTTNFVPGTNRVQFNSGIVGPAVTPDVNNFASFSGTRDSYGVFLRSGDPAPHVGPGVTYSVGVNQTWMAAGDYFVFNAPVNTPEGPIINHMLHYKNAAGELSLLAKQGDTAPGISATFNSLQRAQINSSGKVAFGALVGTAPNRAGIFSGTPGDLTTIAYNGLPAPGTSPGTTFGVHQGSTPDPDRGFQLTESGAIAFKFRLTGGGTTAATDTGIWINDENGTRLALREGAPAGDLTGVNIGAFNSFAFNDNQNLVVLSALVGPNVTTGANGNDQALWLVSPDGTLDLILRKGDFFDVDPSAGVDERQISGIRLGGLNGINNFAAAYMNTFNDNNVLAFGLDFVGGTSGIFVTDLSPIPEPSTLALVGLAFAGFATRRRR